MKNQFRHSGLVLYFIALVSGAFYSVSLHAQSPSMAWARAAKSNNQAYINSVAVDPAGNVYSVGTFYDHIKFGMGAAMVEFQSYGGYDCFVQKHDAAGNLLWVNRLGSVEDDEILDVQLDGMGNVYTSGRFRHIVDFDPDPESTVALTSAGSSDIFIQKYDPAGNLPWVRQMGSGLGESALGLAVSETGEVFCTGYFYGMADFDPGPGTALMGSNGLEDMFIVKLDASGNFAWVRTTGSTGRDYGKHIELDASGNIYTVGQFENTVDFDPGGITPSPATLTAVGYMDFFIQKLAPDGSLQWVKSVGSAYYDFSTGLAIDAGGNVIVCGEFSQPADFDPGPGEYLLEPFDHDIFIMKLNPAGEFSWAHAMGDNAIQRAGQVAVDAKGFIYFMGNFQGTIDFDPGQGMQVETSPGGYSNIFVQKLNSSGNLLWAINLGGNLEDLGDGLAVDASNNVYVGGLFVGPVDFDPGPGVILLTGQPLGVFVLKMSQNTVGTSETTDAPGFLLSPNPVRDILTIQVPRLPAVGVPYFISDLYGRKWMEGRLLERSTQLDLGPLPSGVLVITIGNRTNTFVKS